ncbi:MAG: hypothetical protein AB8F78_05035 [Saprospiraceae bacterium]
MNCHYSFSQTNNGMALSIEGGVQGTFNSFAHDGDFYETKVSNMDIGPFVTIGLGSEDVPWSTQLFLSTGFNPSTFTVSLATEEAPLPFIPTETYSFKTSMVEQHFLYTLENNMSFSLGASLKILHNVESYYKRDLTITPIDSYIYVAPVVSTSYLIKRVHLRALFDFNLGDNTIFDNPMMSTYAIRLQVGYKIF